MDSVKTDYRYNQHTLFVEFDKIVPLEAEVAIKKVIEVTAKSLSLPNSHVINIVSDRNGETFGFCYVWIRSIGLFNALIGKNVDGSERVYFESREINSLNPLDDISTDPHNWADLCESVKVTLEPLMKWPEGYNAGAARIKSSTYQEMSSNTLVASIPKNQGNQTDRFVSEIKSNDIIKAIKDRLAIVYKDQTNLSQFRVFTNSGAKFVTAPFIDKTSSGYKIYLHPDISDAPFINKVFNKIDVKGHTICLYCPSKQMTKK